jgi:hypothetical protein
MARVSFTIDPGHQFTTVRAPMSRARFTPVGLGLAFALVAPGALAQMPGRPGGPHGPVGTDCAIAGVDITVRARRLDAQVDVAFRVRGDKGGQCMLRPEGVMVKSAKGGEVTRSFGELWFDDQIQKPLAVGDATGGDRLRPWVTRMNAKEEHVLTTRFYVEGDVGPNGELDAPGRLTLDMRGLGPHAFEGAPVTVKLALHAGTRGKLIYSSGNPKTPPATHAAGADGGAQIDGKLGMDELAPTIEWKLEGDVPATPTFASIGGGLSALEYLRDGLLRELADGLAAAGKDEKKVAAAWDQAVDTAYVVAKGRDPVVAGMGLRALAFLASGFSASATGIKAEGDAGDAVAVPAKVATELAKVAGEFQNATGQRVAPSPIGSRSARSVLAKLEGASRKKEADEALKRLAKRIEKNEVAAVKVGDVFLASAPQKPGPGAPATAKVLVWGPNGPQYPAPPKVAGAHAHATKRPMGSRMVHALTSFVHRKSMFRAFAGGAVLLGVGLGLAALLGAYRRPEEPEGGASV